MILSAFPQFSDTVSSSDGSLDSAKMAELESRLSQSSVLTERLKVCENICATLKHCTFFFKK